MHHSQFTLAFQPLRLPLQDAQLPAMLELSVSEELIAKSLGAIRSDSQPCCCTCSKVTSTTKASAVCRKKLYRVEPRMLEFPIFRHFEAHVDPSMILQAAHEVGISINKAESQFLQALSERKLVITIQCTSSSALLLVSVAPHTPFCCTSHTHTGCMSLLCSCIH